LIEVSDDAPYFRTPWTFDWQFSNDPNEQLWTDIMDEDVLSLTAKIVSAHVSMNDLAADQLPSLIRTVHEALVTVGRTVADQAKAEPAVSARKSVFRDHIVCLDCGQSFKMLKRHIVADHGLTPDQYRARWGLPLTYPMVAPEYAAQRSQLAKDSGLGKKSSNEPDPPKRGRSAKGK
jgi:predicted transcriptional regulator